MLAVKPEFPAEAPVARRARLMPPRPEWDGRQLPTAPDVLAALAADAMFASVAADIALLEAHGADLSTVSYILFKIVFVEAYPPHPTSGAVTYATQPIANYGMEKLIGPGLRAMSIHGYKNGEKAQIGVPSVGMILEARDALYRLVYTGYAPVASYVTFTNVQVKVPCYDGVVIDARAVNQWVAEAEPGWIEAVPCNGERESGADMTYFRIAVARLLPSAGFRAKLSVCFNVSTGYFEVMGAPGTVITNDIVAHMSTFLRDNGFVAGVAPPSAHLSVFRTMFGNKVIRYGDVCDMRAAVRDRK